MENKNSHSSQLYTGASIDTPSNVELPMSPEETKEHQDPKEVLGNNPESMPFDSNKNQEEKDPAHALIEHSRAFNNYLVIKASSLDSLDPGVLLQKPSEIRYLARKYDFTDKLWTNLLSDLSNVDIDIKTRICFAHALKYQIKKRKFLSYADLLGAMRSNPTEVQSEIAWALGYKMKNKDEQLTLELVQSIEETLSQDLDSKAKNFLQAQIARQHNTQAPRSRQTQDNQSWLLDSIPSKDPQTIVTQSKQASSASSKNTEPQESDINISGLADIIKNLNKKTEHKVNKEEIPQTVQDTSGSDTSFFGSTYTDVQTIYNLARNGKIIKDDDKDNYLVSRFFERKWFSGGLLGELLVERMIAATFNLISKRQRLTEKVVEKLVTCLGDPTTIKDAIIGRKSPVELTWAFWTDWIPENPSPIEKEIVDPLNSMRKDFFKSFNFSHNCQKIMTSNCTCREHAIEEKLKTQPENTKRVEDLTLAEVNYIRLDAMSALYNCVLRDRNALTSGQLSKVKSCLGDTNQKLRSFAIKILGTLDNHNKNDQIDYQELFEACLKQLEKNVDTDDSVGYINQQSIDENRSIALFTQDVLTRLILIINGTFASNEVKLLCGEIINNVLQHKKTKALYLGPLQKCMLAFENSSLSEDVRIEILKCILRTAEKRNILPESVIISLTRNLNVLAEKIANFIIIILGTVCSNVDMTCANEISFKLLDDKVIIVNENEITFEQRTKDNASNISVSSIVGEILLRALEKQAILTAKTLDNIAEALRSQDKETKIRAAKALALVAEKGDSISKEILDILLDYITDSIPDVAIYSTIAFIKTLCHMSKEVDQISSRYMEVLPTVFAFEDKKLGDLDFSSEINKTILTVLHNEASKQTFTEDTLKIFEHIFLSDSPYQKEALDVMQAYISNKSLIPQSTITTIQNMAGKPEFLDQAQNLLGKIIENGQIVSEKVLKIFADHLYFSSDEEVRNRSFVLLDLANSNQDISDEIFDILELERAGQTLRSSRTDQQEALVYLTLKTEAGQRLPETTLKALSHHLENQQTLVILINITKIRQTIPQVLVNQLVTIFDPSQQNQVQLVEIFMNMAKNNQEISKELAEKLEEALGNSVLADNTLLIYTLWGQKGAILSHKIINRICEKFLDAATSQLIKQECLSAICSIIQTHEKVTYDLPCIEDALINGLRQDNQHLIQNSIGGFMNLSEKCALRDESIDALINKAVDSTCSATTKQLVFQILSVYKLSKDQENTLKLAVLSQDSDNQLLTTLTELSMTNKLLSQNFQQIDRLLQSSSVSQQLVINILTTCINKESIPDSLLNNIATIMVSTPSGEIRALCCTLIRQAAESGKKINEKVITLVLGLENSLEAQKILKSISKNQEVPTEVSLILQIDSVPLSIDSEQLTSLLKEVQRELEKGFILPEPTLTKLNSIASFKAEQKLEYNIDIFASILAKGLNRVSQPQDIKSIVCTIEQAIQVKQVNTSVIKEYSKLIEAKKCINLSETLDSLINMLTQPEQQNEENEQLYLAVLSCVKDAFIIGEFSEKGMQLLEDNILALDARIRTFCFQGLRALQDRGHRSLMLDFWCQGALRDLESYLNIPVEEDLDFLGTLASLQYPEYIPFDRLKTEPTQYWTRELLISELVARYKIDETEKVALYGQWLYAEEQFVSQGVIPPDRILEAIIHSQTNNNLKLHDLYAIIQILPIIDIEKACKTLEDSPNPSKALEQQWISAILLRLSTEKIDNKYLDDLSQDISSKFSVEVFSKLVESLNKIDSFIDFQHLLDFAATYDIQATDIPLKGASVNELKRGLEIKILKNHLQNPKSHDHLDPTLNSLLSNEWSFEQLKTAFDSLGPKEVLSRSRKEQDLIQILELLDEYKILPHNYNKVLAIITKPDKAGIKQLNEIAIATNFKEGSLAKNAIQLITELHEKNPESDLIKGLSDPDLLRIIHEVQSSNLTSSILKPANVDNNQYVISQLTKEGISNWAKTVKGSSRYFNEKDFLIEAIAVIRQAVFLDAGYYLTEAQILSCILAVKKKEDKGQLSQVATGEGKSTIICVLAIMNALRGKKVNIITSSPVLAERDAKAKANLYKMFGLSCADNSDKSLYIKGSKDCYKKDIVYGEIAQFQFDILRDQYSFLGTLATRECEVAIVDEVDSMLIDDSSKIARISSILPGLDELQPIYHYLWERFTSFLLKIVVIDDKIYYFRGKITYTEDKIILEAKDNNGEVVKTSDLKQYIQSGGDIAQFGELIEEDPEIFLRKHLKSFISQDIIGQSIVTIPKSLIGFVETQLPKWIDNAIRAWKYDENVYYVVRDGAIKPVEYDTSGVILNSTSWSDGLHQFLQIKHGLKMTSETLTTNFLSNVCYIKKYKSSLYGLTGTLGSKKAQEVLSTVYNVDLMTIPSSYEKQYLELPTIVKPNYDQWLDKICSVAMAESRKQRGALIICETIKQSEIIAQRLKDRYKAIAVKLYTMNNMNQEKEIECIEQGDIIVATNLAGRGTDIKTTAIEENGGLHVIVTFMPTNQRIEEQAFGRTARQGKRGTGQLILNAASLLGYEDISPQKMKSHRNKLESDMLVEFVDQELRVITVKDELFQKFCELLKEIRYDIRVKTGTWQSIKKANDQLFKDDTIKQMTNIFVEWKIMNAEPSVMEVNTLGAIEERWALFLKEIDDGIIPLKESDDRYSKFSEHIKNDFKGKELIKNAYYDIVIANDLAINDSSRNDNHDQALYHFERAIKNGPQYNAAAFKGKAWLMIKGKKKIIGDNKQDKEYKKQATEEFTKSLKLVADEIASLTNIKTMTCGRNSDSENDLVKQLALKMNLLGYYSSSIEKAISVIKKSRRLITVVGTKTYQNCVATEMKGNESVSRSDYSAEVAKINRTFHDLERTNEGEIPPDLGQHDTFSVIFNDLTVRNDSGTIDQAIDTITKVFYNYHDSSYMETLIQSVKRHLLGSTLNPENYKGLSISINTLYIETLQTMLSFDIEFRDVSKEIALTKLNDKKSFFNEGSVGLKVNTEDTNHYLHITGAIKIVESKKDDNLRFNLKFVNANENAKILKKILENSTLDLEFTKLTLEEGKTLLQKIESEPVHLEIFSTKAEILGVLANLPGKLVQLIQANSAIDETLYVDKLKERIDKLEEEEFVVIKCKDLEKSETEKLMKKCPEAIFHITFVNVNAQSVMSGIGSQQMKASFNKLSPESAIELITILRKEHLDFSLRFDDLSQNKLREVVREAVLDQENIEISKVQSLSDLFMKDSLPTLEVSELAARGIQYILEINEKRFIPWRSILAVGALAVVQMVAGALLIMTGFGATAGIGIITEGVADLMTAYNSYSSRQFVWSDYVKQKAVSLAISAVSMGWGNIKNAGRGMKNILTGIGHEALEQAGTQVVMGGKEVGKTLINSAQALKAHASTQVKIAVGEAVLREGLNKGVEAIFTLEHIKPRISDFIQQKVGVQFYKANLIDLLRKMLALDKIQSSNSNTLKYKIDKIVKEIINPERSFWSNQWNSIGLPLLKGILSDGKFVNGSIGMGIRVGTTLSGLHQVIFIIDSIHEELVKKLSELHQEILSESQLLSRYCGLTNQEAKDIIELLKTAPTKRSTPSNIYFKAVDLSNINFDNLDFNQQDKHKKSVKDFCEKLDKHASSINDDDFSQIKKSVSDSITDQIIRIMDSQVITSWTTLAVGKLTAAISAKIQTKLAKRDLDTQMKLLDKSKKDIEAKKDKTNGDINLINEYVAELKEARELAQRESLTYAELIGYQATKYTIAYNQSSILYYAGQNIENNKRDHKVVKKVDERAIDILTGKAADMADMQIMASQNGVEIKIVTNVNHKLTNEELARGVQLVLFTPPDKNANADKIGHYSLLGSDGKITEVLTTGGNCGFGVMSAILQEKGVNKSIGELRTQLGQTMILNANNTAKILEAHDWIRDHHSQKANNLLCLGGDRAQVMEQLSQVIAAVKKLLPYGASNNDETGIKGRPFIPLMPETERRKQSKMRTDLARKELNFTGMYGAGNCGENANIAFNILKEICPGNVIIERRTATHIKHGYVAIKPIGVLDDSQTIIIDPWPSNQITDPHAVDSADHFSDYTGNYKVVNTFISNSAAIGGQDNWDDINLGDIPGHYHVTPTSFMDNATVEGMYRVKYKVSKLPDGKHDVNRVKSPSRP